MKTIDKIRDFIAKGETEKAVGLLVQYTREQKPDLQNDAVLLSSRYQQWKRNVTIGINESSNDLRHIENGILTLLENSNTNSTTATPPPVQKATTSTPQHVPAASPPQKSSNLMPIVIGLLGLGALIMMGFWIFGDDHADDHAHAGTTTEVTKTPETKNETKPINSKPTDSKPVDKPVTTKPIPESTAGTKFTKPPLTKLPEGVSNSNIIQQSPIKKLQQVNGKNVNLIEVSSGFYYRYMGNKKWVESNSKTFKSMNHFEEKSRDANIVYLFDKARGVKMQIDLARMKMTYSDRNSKKRDLYTIKKAMNMPTGNQMVRVEYTGGYFELKEGKTWIEKNNKSSDTFTETGRDVWFVTLTNKHKDIRLDLKSKKVMYNEKGKSLAPLYSITKVY